MSSAATLADVLYADKWQALVSEKDWVQLVHSVAAGDQHALHALYERTDRIVFTLAARLTGTRKNAEERTLGVFHDVWRRASRYDAGKETVVGWIMNQARSKGDSAVVRQAEDARVNQSSDRPPASLQQRLAQRIIAETGAELALLPPQRWVEPEWKEVAPGISCKLLANDTERQRVSMLVRLSPGVDYPSHRHAGVEELHLLHGELMIDDRKLYPGDYNRAESGTVDNRVWSETGCTCVLMTSTRDELR
jgi:anti-sigma factor ChrR (cupin superfamily)